MIQSDPEHFQVNSSTFRANFQELFIDEDSKVFLNFQAIFFKIAMASRSAPTLTNVVVPVVVDIKDCPRPIFKKYP